MALRINRVRAVAANDAGFADLLAVLPDGVGPCLCCRRSSPNSPALILVADESDDDPRALCAAVCSMCSAAYPATSCSPTGSGGWQALRRHRRARPSLRARVTAGCGRAPVRRRMPSPARRRNPCRGPLVPRRFVDNAAGAGGQRLDSGGSAPQLAGVPGPSGAPGRGQSRRQAYRSAPKRLGGDQTMSGRTRLPGGQKRKASQRHSRPVTTAPAVIVLTPQWRPGDRVRWREYAGTFLRDTVDNNAEVLIGTRTYRLPKAELRPA